MLVWLAVSSYFLCCFQRPCWICGEVWLSLLQAYGPGALRGMLAWLRHVAQGIGKGSLTEEPLVDNEEAQIYQQVQNSSHIRV